MTECESVENFLDKFQNIQESLLYYLDDQENMNEGFQNLKQIFEVTRIRECIHEIRLFIHLLITIADNCHRDGHFFNKIYHILLFIKENLTQFKNEEIFNLFQSNKRILLFLIEEGILRVDKYFIKQIANKNFLEERYPQYFAPEIKPFINEDWFPNNNLNDEFYIEETNLAKEIKKELPAKYNENRKIGENESYICQLIRNDAVEEFIAYVNKNCIKCNATIIQSICKTNELFIKKQTDFSKGISMIEYEAFFGSIQIFTMIKSN